MEIYGILMLIVWIGTTQAILPPSWKAKINEAPYYAYISDGYYYCGGAVIYEDKILTAAHCMVENMPFHKDIIVTAGTITPDRLNKDKQTRTVEKVLVHDEYKLGANHVQAFYDIALIKLVSPFKISPSLQLVKLGAIDTSQGALIYGFGSTHVTHNNPSDYLLGKIVKLIPDDVCQKMLNNTKTKSIKQEYEICLTNGYCHGDSGSPLIQVQNKVARVVGVASWVADDIYGCNTPPAIALNVDYFSDWLKKGLERLQ